MKTKRKKHSRINWSTVDWTKSNKAIAIDLGTSKQVVARARCKHALRLIHVCPECKCGVDPETYKEKSNKKKLCRACFCGWKDDLRLNPWTHSMISLFRG